jgi:hypothetical protein
LGRDPFVMTPQRLHSLPPAITAPLPSRDPALQAPQLPLRFAGEMWILYQFARTQGRESAQAHVDTNRAFVCQGGDRLDLIHEDLREPASCPVNDPQEPLRFANPLLAGTVLDQTEFGNRQQIVAPDILPRH